MPKKLIKKKEQLIASKKGTKCSLCGEILTMPIGIDYLFDNVPHPAYESCIKYLCKELQDTKSELQDLKDRVRDLEQNLHGKEYH